MKSEKGAILTTLLIVTTAFIIVIYALLFILTLQFDFSQRQIGAERALHIAEAGINYYRWHLAHDPDDFQDGTGQAGQYLHDYLDPQGTSIGKFSLDITPPTGGSSIVTIRSTGWSNEFPKIKRTIKVEYGIPSFAQFSFLQHANSWYGVGTTINGRIHSNGGIRMDGINTSIVSSSQQSYMCGTETGCFPPEPKPGVWGSGSDQSLWQFPVSPVDFNSLSFDFANMKVDAQNNGIYLDDSNKDGYHLVFKSDGTLDVYKVNSTDQIKGYSVPGQGLGTEGIGGCRKIYQIIANESLIGTYDITNIPIIFIEDTIWVEGTVKGRLTLAAAEFPIVSSYADIWINNNLTYASYDGSNILGLVSQNNIFIPKDVPDYFQIDAVMIAQAGKIIRHGYMEWCHGSSTGILKQKLTINGSIISYFKSYWDYEPGPESGFLASEINYDTNAVYNPPPYFPTTGEYELISWIEE